jgi:hypothetical protein
MVRRMWADRERQIMAIDNRHDFHAFSALVVPIPDPPPLAMTNVASMKHSARPRLTTASSALCRFPASGSSRKSFARGCVPMDDPDCWQWVTREEIIQSIPVEPTPTIPRRQPFLPDPDDLIGVPAQSFDVAWRHPKHRDPRPVFRAPL